MKIDQKQFGFALEAMWHQTKAKDIAYSIKTAGEALGFPYYLIGWGAKNNALSIGRTATCLTNYPKRFQDFYLDETVLGVDPCLGSGLIKCSI